MYSFTELYGSLSSCIRCAPFCVSKRSQQSRRAITEQNRAVFVELCWHIERARAPDAPTNCRSFIPAMSVISYRSLGDECKNRHVPHTALYRAVCGHDNFLRVRGYTWRSLLGKGEEAEWRRICHPNTYPSPAACHHVCASVCLPCPRLCCQFVFHLSGRHLYSVGVLS